MIQMFASKIIQKFALKNIPKFEINSLFYNCVYVYYVNTINI